MMDEPQPVVFPFALDEREMAAFYACSPRIRAAIAAEQAELAAARRILALLPAELLKRAAGYAREVGCADCPYGEDCRPDWYILEPWTCRRDAAALAAAAREREGQ